MRASAVAGFKFSPDASQAGFTSRAEARIFLAGGKQIEIFVMIAQERFSARNSGQDAHGRRRGARLADRQNGKWKEWQVKQEWKSLRRPTL